MPTQRAAHVRDLLLFAASLFLALALFEGMARLLPSSDVAAKRGLDLQHFSADRAAQPDPLLGYRLRRNVSVANFRFNNHGFVGQDFAVPKPAGVLRIICLGDSTTLGAGADADRFSYPALLGEIFRRTERDPDHRVEVLNGGVFGYHSWHTLLRVKKELRDYQPDVYVLMDGLNDVMAACRQMSPNDLERLGDSMDAILLTLTAPQSPGITDWLSRNLSRLASYRLAGEIGRKLRGTPPAPGGDEYTRRMEQFRFRDNLEAILRQAKTDAVGLLLVNYPWIAAQEPDVAQAMGIDADLAHVYAFGRDYVAGVNRAISRKEGVPLMDPQSFFDQETKARGNPRLLFSDTVHFSRRGNFELAKHVYRALMTDPAVIRACDRDTPVPVAQLDALFPDILAWRPTDGSGWPTARELPLSYAILEQRAISAGTPDAEGTTALSPEDAHAVIRLRLSGTPPDKVFFFPRVGGDGKSKVLVRVVKPDENAHQAFVLENRTGDAIWSPVSGRFELALPSIPGLTIEIELSGHDAQVWARGDHLPFAAPDPAASGGTKSGAAS